jgi:hypothetical protein
MASGLLYSGSMEVLRIAIAILGALGILLGYRLFSGSPLRIVSGALLALFGVGIISADLIGLRNHGVVETRPPTHHTKPAGMSRHRASTDWFV